MSKKKTISIVGHTINFGDGRSVSVGKEVGKPGGDTLIRFVNPDNKKPIKHMRISAEGHKVLCELLLRSLTDKQ